MTFPDALREATATAKRHGVTICVMHDPIANAEEEGDFSFCPPRAVPMLFRHGTEIVRIVDVGLGVLHRVWNPKRPRGIERES